MSDKGWIGVDLDGSLAEYNGWIKGGGIGPPIPKMIDRVKQWLKKGKTVKIMTARVSNQNIQGLEEERGLQQSLIQEWCLKHIGQILPITCEKDLHMYELWDDRAIELVPNTGESLRERLAEAQEDIRILRKELATSLDTISRYLWPDTTGQ